MDAAIPLSCVRTATLGGGGGENKKGRMKTLRKWETQSQWMRKNKTFFVKHSSKHGKINTIIPDTSHNVPSSPKQQRHKGCWQFQPTSRCDGGKELVVYQDEEKRCQERNDGQCYRQTSCPLIRVFPKLQMKVGSRNQNNHGWTHEDVPGFQRRT